MFVARWHPSLPTWCLFKNLGVEGEVQEAVFTVQGVLTEFQLPPLEKIMSRQPGKYHYLHQSITVSGLDTPFFGEAVMAVNEIYGMFDRAFSHMALGSWNLTDCHGPSIEASNHYFTPVRQGLALASLPFQENVDPCGILAKMEASPGARCVPTEDNEVKYCRAFREPDGRYRFEACPPQLFRKGDIVEAQLSFIIVPIKEELVKGKQYKMLVVLRSMALLDTQFSSVRV
ncbi:hypothetical protein L208DRAFT_1291452 [Tricholoma matsutake]|nr:hypothetical protein L208DRAFT_1291452 [Tricholoma matsutake 945]